MEIKLTVHFIGAGPGDPELITLKGKKLLEQCSICFFAGSIIPEEILSHCGPSTKKINTAPLSLSQIIEKIEKFGKTFSKLTNETVKGFLKDSTQSKFEI